MCDAVIMMEAVAPTYRVKKKKKKFFCCCCGVYKCIFVYEYRPLVPFFDQNETVNENLDVPEHLQYVCSAFV